MLNSHNKTIGFDDFEMERAMDADNELTVLKEQERGLLEIQKEKGEAREEERFTDGWLQRGKIERDFNRMLDLVALYRLKLAKDYKKAGLTWAQYCENNGYSYKSVNRWLEDFTPILESFSDNLSIFMGVPINKIKYLSKAISDNLSVFDGKNLVVKDEAFPVSNSEEMNAAIDTLRDKLSASERAAKKLQDELSEAEKEHSAEIKEYRSQIKDLKAITSDPAIPEGFAEIFKQIEQKTTDIVILANKLDFKRTFADCEDEMTLLRKYVIAVGVMEHQFTRTIEDLKEALHGRE